MTHDKTSDESLREMRAAEERTMQSQSFPVNLYEAPEALVLVAPLPAVTPEDVTVELRAGALHITAHLRSAAPREYLIHEWEYGGYEREVELPDGYGSGLEAGLNNGQLVVRVLRGPQDQPLSVQPT